MRIFQIFLLILASACQKRPATPPAADNFSALLPPPMGANSYNDVLERELETIESDFLKAKHLFTNRRFIESSMLLTKILKKDPHLLEARNLLARAVFFLGNPDKAFLELKEIIDLSKAKNDRTSMLDALYLMGAMTYESEEVDEHRVNAGITAWENFLKQANPDPILAKEIHTGLANLKQRLVKTKVDDSAIIAFERGDFSKALNLCETLLAQKYDKHLALIKARIFIRTGRVDEAHAQFAIVLQKNPDFAEGWHYFGMAHMLKGQTKEAISAWKKVIELDKAYADTNALAGRIAIAEGMLKE